MRIILIMVILFYSAFAVLGNNIKDLYLKAGARGLALAIEMESDDKPVFSSRATSGGFEVAIKNCGTILSLTEFTDFGIGAPLKSISLIKKNGSILIKGQLKDNYKSSPVSKMSGLKILVLVNKENYPEMTWRASEYDFNDKEDASFAVSDDKASNASSIKTKVKSKEVVANKVEPKAEKKPAIPEPVIPEPAIEPEKIEENSAQGFVETIKGGINFRSTPNSSSKENISAVLELGVRAELLSKSGAWYKVKTERSGKVGWLHSSLVKPVEAAVAESNEKEVEIADAKVVSQNTEPIATDVKQRQHESTKPNIKEYKVFGRDPFLPLDKCDFLLPDLPNVEEADLVGIIYDNMDRIALIETKSKKGELESHTLRENSTIYNGRVLKIQEDAVVFLISEAMYSRKYVLKMKEEIED